MMGHLLYDSGHVADLVPSWEAIGWPVLNMGAELLGLLAVQKSFEGPEILTGINTAIFGSNAMIVMTFNYLLLGYMPSWQEQVGMTIVITGSVMAGMCKYITKPSLK